MRATVGLLLLYTLTGMRVPDAIQLLNGRVIKIILRGWTLAESK